MNRKTHHNRRLAQWRVTWLIEHSTSHQLLWCIDSFVLRNPPLRQAPNRYLQAYELTLQLFSRVNKQDKMNLRQIQLNEDKTNEAYASADCQQLLQMYNDFYPQIGFNSPWVGYFVVRQNQIVGSCSFVGQPQDGKVEVSYWTFKEFEGQGIASFACKELVTIATQTDP